MVDWVSFKRARGFLTAERWRIIGAGACAVLSVVCFVGLVILLGELAELLITPKHSLKPPTLGHSEPFSLYGTWRLSVYNRFGDLPDSIYCLGLLLGAMVVLAGIRSLCNYLQARLIAVAVTDAARRMRRAIHHQAYRLGTTEVSGIGAAPAINVFTRETDTVRDGLTAWLDASVKESIKLVLLLLIALLAHVVLAALFMILAFMGAFLVRRQAQSARARATAAIRNAAERLALLQESLFQIRLTRGYLMESPAAQRFERNLQDFTENETRRMRSSAAGDPIQQFVAFLCVTLVVGLASFHLLSDVLSPSSTVLLYASLISIYGPVMKLYDRFRAVRHGAESASAVFAFIDQHSRLGQVADASFLSPMSQTLEFVNVHVEEPGQPAVLRGINLTIKSGTRTAIMGLDERSKRALVYLVPRFLDPSEGRVQIDGQDIRLVTLESLRAQVAFVLQDEMTFSATVAENIGCGDPSFGLPHIVDAAKIAHAHSFIQRLPKGYDTLIGDMGESLSISQQFRIALARAIVRDPTIVIIEEPTAHLDEDTKNLLDDTLMRFCPGRTVIFLPHRLSTIRNCDSIIILHEGMIAASGNHRELTISSELYRHLQYTEFNVFANS